MAQENSPKWRMTSAFKQAVMMIVAIVLFVFCINYVTIPMRVNGNSMMNNLYDGDIALMNGLIFNEKSIHRFDVVVIETEDLPLLIKRVIGLPGDTVTYKDDVLYINGEIVEESFLDPVYVQEAKKQYNRKHFTDNFTVSLGEDEFFVLGDNRVDSADSRILGAFSLKNIKTKKGVVVYPFNHARINN